MSAFQVFVQAISFGDQFLFPLSESLLLDLDLFGKALSEVLFLFLELGVVQLSRSGFSKFPGLHLECPVGLVMGFFCSMDEVEHVSSDEDRAQFLEVAMIFILDLCHTPSILAAFHDTTVGGLNVLLRTNNRERHGCHQATSMLSGMFIVLFDWWLIYFYSLGFDDGSNLERLAYGTAVAHKYGTYPLLKPNEVRWAQCIGLRNNGNEVDSRTQPLHNFNIERLQGVPCGSNKVQAGVDTEIDFVDTAGLLFLQHVRLVLVVQKFDDRHPRVSVVDIVTKSGGINNGQANYKDYR